MSTRSPGSGSRPGTVGGWRCSATPPGGAGPFGTGTTSALTGAYVLAGELGATPDDIPAAFARYERVLRPLTDRAQKSVPRAMHPRVEWHRSLLRAGLHVIGGVAGRRIGRALSQIPAFDPTPPVDTVALPDHPTTR